LNFWLFPLELEKEAAATTNICWIVGPEGESAKANFLKSIRFKMTTVLVQRG
jgi:hypothetical protein